eukprot:1547673-Ditylum_brightwellii.AAC.1
MNTFNRTMSLWNQVSVAMGLQNMGHATFWSQVYNKLGMHMSSSMTACLKEKDAKLAKRQAKAKTPELKKVKVKVKTENMCANN